jgi:hypothetical protein
MKNDYHYVSHCYTFEPASPGMETLADQDEKKFENKRQERGIP